MTAAAASTAAGPPAAGATSAPSPRRRTGSRPSAGELLAAAVGAVPGGASRPGQEQMAAAIEAAIGSREHLLVQAGTGTGKSLGYLAPTLVWLADHPQERVVIAT
ncbi:MAG TPA: hypothetical protein VF657_10070, partial [Actinoplanes sp.]